MKKVKIYKNNVIGVETTVGIEKLEISNGIGDELVVEVEVEDDDIEKAKKKAQLIFKEKQDKIKVQLSGKKLPRPKSDP